MTHQLDVLRTSVQRLHDIVVPLDDDAIVRPAYPTEWSIAQVLSHLGSGSVIFRRRIDDLLADTETPDEFAPATWDEWNAKSPRAQVDDGLAADAALLDRFDALSDDDRARLVFPMGPMSFAFDEFVGLRVNEHALHTWDVGVALDPTATIPGPIADVVVDQLELIARYTARPIGEPRTVSIATTEPGRGFALQITDDSATFSARPTPPLDPDVELPAEALIRLVYGRLDPDHTPPFRGDGTELDRLRQTFPGA